ncbi:MAG: pseudouridine synthase [Bacteroidota bacterium]
MSANGAPRPLRVIYQDAHFLAIHKPPKLIVHLTRISEDTDSVVRRLREQLQEPVNLVHRLDRATSGVLLFSRTREAAQAIMGTFAGNRVQKEYLAVVRGFIEAPGRIDHPVRRADGRRIQAQTEYAPLAQVEVPIAVRPYAQSRYSLVRICPKTGKYRQIRQHFQHLRKPIIGDKKHGDINHNRMFREQLGCDIMLFLARELRFVHPFTGTSLVIRTQPEPAMQAIIERFGWAHCLSE